MTPAATTLELVFRCLSDPPPSVPTDCAFLFSETRDNEASVVRAAADLFQAAATRTVLVVDSEPRCGYAGVEHWGAALAGLDVAAARAPTTSYSSLNTLTESHAFVDWAIAHQIRTAHVLAAPFHQVRAYMTLVSVLLRRAPELVAYSHPGAALAWDDFVVHSQGRLAARRGDLVGTELGRIERYRAQGDLVSDDEILRYMDRRRRA